MAGKPDKERMGQDMKYVIDSKVYENHINDEVHLYGLLHQLAFLAGKAKDEKDLDNLAETAKRYGEIAEEKFAVWRIPGRYLVFGDRKDLAELKAAELTPLTAPQPCCRSENRKTACAAAKESLRRESEHPKNVPQVGLCGGSGRHLL